MVIDSTTATPVYLTTPPDWGKPMQLQATYKTGIATGTTGCDQRARFRMRPLYSFTFTIGAMTTAQFAARRAAILAELQAPVIVPIWTDAYTLGSMIDANTPSFSIATLAPKKFKLNGYCFFSQGANTSFRLITAVNTTTLSLSPGSFPTYTAGALVYPCIFGFRTKNKNFFKLNALQDTDETVSIEEL